MNHDHLHTHITVLQFAINQYYVLLLLEIVAKVDLRVNNTSSNFLQSSTTASIKRGNTLRKVVLGEQSVIRIFYADWAKTE